jgi:hypothetical protein
MRNEKLSEYIFGVDLEHESASFGVWDFKTFYTRPEALDFAESMAKNNPDMRVSVSVRPRFRKKNALRSPDSARK